MTRRPFHDPYDSMSDRDFDQHVEALFERTPERTVPVSIRWPEQLLARVKRVADSTGIPYQTLIKDLVAAALPVAERRQQTPATPRRSAKVATASRKIASRRGRTGG
jgi:predicted DNA binding CopG/RHH family protein